MSTLDRETSGLLVFARTEEVKFAFQRGWKSVTKKYHAVIRARWRLLRARSGAN